MATTALAAKNKTPKKTNSKTSTSLIIKTSGQWASPAKSAVQKAFQLAPASTFDDPFGDKQPVESLNLQAEEAEPLLFSAPKVAAVETDRAAFSLPGAEPLPPGTPLSSGAPLSPGAKEPCDRVYNNRNCCSEEARCENLRLLLRDNPITKVSLNISPSLKPNSGGAALQSTKNKLLAEMPSRIWKNRDGEIMAEGLLTDLAYGNALIDQGGEIVKLPIYLVSDSDRCFINAWWRLPPVCRLDDRSYLARDWTPLTMTWTASALCHKPLYFEEIQLERYGHTTGPIWQPAISGAHFFMNVLTLPYHSGIHPMHECRYALGYYRPGNCAPWLLNPIPLSVRGGLMQAGAVAGGIAIIP